MGLLTHHGKFLGILKVLEAIFVMVLYLDKRRKDEARGRHFKHCPLSEMPRILLKTGTNFAPSALSTLSTYYLLGQVLPHVFSFSYNSLYVGVFSLQKWTLVKLFAEDNIIGMG